MHVERNILLDMALDDVINAIPSVHALEPEGGCVFYGHWSRFLAPAKSRLMQSKTAEAGGTLAEGSPRGLYHVDPLSFTWVENSHRRHAVLKSCA